MDNIIKIPYEISLWEDVRKLEVYRNEEYVPIDPNEVKDGDIVVNSFFEEQKIAIIGSNTMTSPARVIEPCFTERINGEILLNFSIFYRYYDEEKDEIVNNPFINLLCNERKVKLSLIRNPISGKKEWYDFVIKDIQEDSEQNKFIYSARGLFINELSKTGFELTFDAELENNQGTAAELGERALKGSDWQFKGSEVLVEKSVEALYEIVLNKGIIGTKTISKTSEGDSTSNIPSGKTIYVFYNVLAQKSSYFQFLYFGDKTETQIEALLDEDGVVIDEDNQYSYHIENFSKWEKQVNNIKLEVKSNSVYIPAGITGQTKVTLSETAPRGERIIRRGITRLDPNIDKYVTVFRNNEDEKKEIYRFSETTYATSATPENLLTNGYMFTSHAGWESVEAGNYVVVSAEKKTESTDNGILFDSYLNFYFVKGDHYILNTGLYNSRTKIKNFTKGETYALKWNKKKTSLNLSAIVATYSTVKDTNDSLKYKIENTIFKWENINDLSGTKEAIATESVELMGKDKIGFFIKKTGESDYSKSPIQFSEIRLFKKYTDANGDIIIPGETVTPKVTNTYYFYDPDDSRNEDVKDSADLVYLKISENPDDAPEGYKLLYDENFNKNRSITVKESNRFNIIQTICETFECWADFEIEHDDTGKIIYTRGFEEIKGVDLSIGDYYFTTKEEFNNEPFQVDSETKTEEFLEKIYYRRIAQQNKFVSFREYIGKDNYAGFKYGINLKSIQRNVNSDQIVTKIIVKDNANEYATNGACSIARADDSPTKENFLFNFDYYINQRLLSYNDITNDLYLDAPQYLNYYNKLRRINANREELITEQSEIETAIVKIESNITVYKTGAEEATNLFNQELIELRDYLGLEKDSSYKTITDAALERIKIEGEETYSDTNAAGRLSALEAYNQRKNAYSNLADAYENSLNQEKNRLSTIKKELENIALEKALLNKKFYEKYSRFIQEGSWISDDYMDDNLYYFDAEGVLYTSSRPQISYTINLIDLSRLEEYKNYFYRIGDKTYIEDTEFFGWKAVASVLTPAQEEVIVSEYIHYLDTPEQDIITVQNYKTQFEDLYQRITATTNSFQFHSGEYGRAAAAVQPDGTFNSSSLQNSLRTTAYILENAKNQSVVWDDTGITTTNLTNPNEIVRITSGAIAISNDGGQTWSSAMTGNGINANYIVAGQIDVNKIRIMNGDFPSFSWDANGLNAYNFISNADGSYINTNFNQYIRFDQYGIYGVNGKDKEWIPKNINEILNAKEVEFGLTWDGLIIKNNDSSVQIDSKDDITVTDKEGLQRVKIGRIFGDGELTPYEYGIRFKNEEDQITLETDSKGKLWLRDYITVGSNDATSATAQVKIGYDENKLKEQNSNIHAVIQAGINDNSNSFIVYEDGSVEATGVNISGIIEAKSGTIGKMKINEDGSLSIVGGNNTTTYLVDENKTLLISSKNNTTIFSDENETLSIISNNNTATFLVDENKTLSIIGGDSTPSFFVDANGNVSITGIINASSGSFTGKITATSGKIGSMVVDGNTLSINKVDGTPSFSVDENGNVSITGTVNATDGYFKGKITAESGTIGGFIISNEKEKYILINSEDQENYEVKNCYEYEPEVYELVTDKDTIDNEDHIYIKKENGTYEEVVDKNELIAPGGAIKECYIKIGRYVLSKDEEFVSGKDYYRKEGGPRLYSQNGGIVLDGSNNKIEAETITLGTGAIISDYIKLGKAYIQNPDKNEGNFIRTENGGLKITDTGIITAGNINIDGTTSKVKVGNYMYFDGVENELYAFDPDLEQRSWSITPDKSIFNNITVRGSIQAATFEYGKVTTVGGIIFVKTSSAIKKVENNKPDTGKITISLESVEEFQPEDLVVVLEDFSSVGFENRLKYKILEVVKSNNADPIVILKPIEEKNTGETDDEFYKRIKISEESKGLSLIKLASDYSYKEINDKSTFDNAKEVYINKNNNYEIIEKPIEMEEGKTYYIKERDDNFAIGINSTDNEAFISKKSISMVELKEYIDNKDNNKKKYKYVPKLILGDLSSNYFLTESNAVPLEGYGLYAENVYLKGRLLSLGKDENGNIKSSGINSNGQGTINTPDDAPWNTKNNPLGKSGKIILWAGAIDNSGLDASTADFQVDEYGNMYANSGYFKGAIITDSYIGTSEIKTALITGTGSQQGMDYGLFIQNAENGIVFVKNIDENNKTINFTLDDLKNNKNNVNTNIIFKLSTEETTINNKLIVEGNEGNYSRFKVPMGINNLVLLNNTILYNPTTQFEGNIPTNTGSISLSNTNVDLMNKLIVESNAVTIKNNLDIEGTEIEYKTGKVKINVISDSENRKYGYDIYVTE